MLTALVAALLVLGSLGIALRIYMGREAEDHLQVEEVVDFKTLVLPGRGNAYLMCPGEPRICPVPADQPSPVFEMGWERLRDYWGEAVAAQPRVALVDADSERRHLVYIQRSALFRFPDILTVEFIPLGTERSTLAVLSRSRYGRSDFGVNRSRVRHWVELVWRLTREAHPA